MAAQRLRQLVSLPLRRLLHPYERLERVQRPLEAVDVQNVQLKNVAALENRGDATVLVRHQNRRDVLAFQQEKRYIASTAQLYPEPPTSTTSRKSHLCTRLNSARGSFVGREERNDRTNTQDSEGSRCM